MHAPSSRQLGAQGLTTAAARFTETRVTPHTMPFDAVRETHNTSDSMRPSLVVPKRSGGVENG